MTGNNAHGFTNEKNLSIELNNKKFCELDLNLKEFINYICKTKNIVITPEATIYSHIEPNNKLKQDLYITIQSQTFGVSLKMGSGNSVHQEKCEDFICYLADTFEIDNELKNNFRLFLWADGTNNGSGSLAKDSNGKILTRFTSKEFSNRYPQEKASIQKFLDDNAVALINHFLFIGRHGSKVDFIYHGTPRNGSWVSSEALTNYQIHNSKTTSNSITVGRMSLQAWNASIKGTSEHKRGQLQLKYSRLKNDLTLLMENIKLNTGTFYGDATEYSFVKLMNKDKKHKFWKVIFPTQNDFSNYYVVRVDKKVLSSLSGKSVFSKSDAYIIRTNLEHSFLIQNEYLLSENMIKDCHTLAIIDSGISIKIKDSKSFTIQKFTKDSFIKAFKNLIANPQYTLVGLLLYSKEEEIYKNKKILQDFNISCTDFLSKINETFSSKFSNLDSATAESIRQLNQSHIINIINNNPELKSSIFTGKGWFKNPYFINFIYKYGELKQHTYSNFAITTGSGRTKGKYSIEVKPK